VLLAVVLVWAPGRASAQVSVSGPAATPHQIDVTLTGDVTTSVFIQVDGSVDLNGNLPTVITGSGTAGFVNFGTYNAATPLLTGEKHKVVKKGTYLVATLAVSVRLSGGPASATVDIQRTNPITGAPDIAAGSLLYARPAAKKKNARLSWPKWNKFPEVRYGTSVFDVPPSTFVPGAGNLDAAMANGDSLDHQVAIWIPDSLPAAPFSTLVTYTAIAP
jgi:hypothetical protein